MYSIRLVQICILFVVLLTGCAKSKLDPNLYPTDWPLTEITTLETSKPAAFPDNWSESFADTDIFTDHSYSSTGSPSMKLCGICFTNDAGWEAVFNDLDAKCARSGFTIFGKEISEDPKVFIRSAGWARLGGTLTLFEITTNKFILDVVHIELPKNNRL